MTLKWASAAGLQSTAAGMEWSGITGAITIETTISRSNGTAFRVAPGATKSVQHSSYSSGQGNKFYRVYAHLVTAPNASRDIISLDNASNLKIGIRMTSSRILQLFNVEDNTQIGSDSSAINTGEFYRIELNVDDTTLSSTSVEARLYAAADEETLLWNPSGTANLAAAPNRLTIANRNDSTLDFVFTDIVIIEGDATVPNTWAGQGSIVYLRPSAVGSNNEWARGGTDSGANWSQTDETPPNDVTDYVQSNTNNQIDDYNLSATPGAVASDDVINWVVPGARFVLSSTSGGDPDCVLRVTAGGNTEESGNISGAGSTFWASYQTTPALVFPMVLLDLPGGSTTAWTKSDLDSAEIGVRESATDTHFIRVSALWLMFEHKPSSGTLFTQSTDGTLTSSGGLLKLTSKSFTGTSTSSGAVNKLASKLFAGTLTSAGTLLKQTTKVLEGAISSLVGTLDTARIILKELSGSMEFSGNILKDTSKFLGSILSASGDILKLINKLSSGELSSSGNTTKTGEKILTGEITLDGNIEKQSEKITSGELTSDGEISKHTSKSFSGTITPAKNLIKQANIILSGILDFVGEVVGELQSGSQTFFKELEGTLTSSGLVQKLTSKFYSGTITTSGDSTKITNKEFSGELESSGTLSVVRAFVKILEGTLSLAGDVLKKAEKNISGQVTTSGNVNKFINKSFLGELVLSGVVSVTKTFIKVLEGLLALSGDITRDTRKSVSGEISSSGIINRTIEKSLTASLNVVGSLNKLITKTVSGILDFIGNLLGLPGSLVGERQQIQLKGTLDYTVQLKGTMPDHIELSGTLDHIIHLEGTK